MSDLEAEAEAGGPNGHHVDVESKLTAELSPEEEDSVLLFMTHVNSWRRARSFAPLSRETSVKFLMARKFAVDRALSLYQQHELMRLREKLTQIDANAGPLKVKVHSCDIPDAYQL